MALAGVTFGVDGAISVDCCSLTAGYSGLVYLKDTYAFPDVWYRQQFEDYRAAYFLINVAGYKAHNVQGLWNESIDWVSFR